MSDLLGQIDEIIEDAPDSGQQSEVDQITELLAAPSPEPEGVEVDEPVREDDTDQEEAAQEEAVEVEIPDTVDYKAEIPMSDGSKVSLGELKDHYQDQQGKILEMQERENAIAAQMNEVQEMAQYAQLPPEKVEQIRQEKQRYMSNQHEMMLKTMPELNDQAQFTAAKTRMFELAKEYGVVEEVGNWSNHKLIKLLNDHAKLREGIKSATSNVKPLRKREPTAKTKSVGKVNKVDALAKQARQSGSKGDQIAAIEALL
jgi:hypothetical protein